MKRKCRICGCTDEDCSQCIEAQGYPAKATHGEAELSWARRSEAKAGRGIAWQRQGEAELSNAWQRRSKAKAVQCQAQHSKGKAKEVNMRVEITLIEELLATSSSNPSIQREFISSKAPDALSREEEIAALGVDEVVEKSMTMFPKENGVPFLWDYQVKGFFKDACSALARVKTSRSSKLKAYRKIIDGLVFVMPRKVTLKTKGIGNCQRPLRGQTLQGERVALANSEAIPAGTRFECEIKLLDPALEETLREWLDYGELRGLGQWRNSGKGRFTWREI